METTRITLSDLESMEACSPARNWFAGEFPYGASLEEAWRACPVDQWRVWFACRWLTKGDVVDLAFRFAGQAFRFAGKLNPALAEYADNITESNLLNAARAARIARATVAADATERDALAVRAADDAAHYATSCLDGYDNAAGYAYFVADAAVVAGDASVCREQVAWCAQALGLA
jgi:hypothetical protein